VILCDWCGGQKECLQKEIDGREFDICGDCWRQIEEKLEGSEPRSLRWEQRENALTVSHGPVSAINKQ
jgi:hypothetical protein